MRYNLTNEQHDYSFFLPAISSFYSTYVGKQRFDKHVPQNRIPACFNNGVENLNFLNHKQGQFQYKWALYSAGHAELDTTQESPKEDMLRNRDREESWVLGDSGGFQIGKGVWEGDWKDPNCPKASKKRDQVLKWMDAYMDYGMILDIPAWVCRSPEGIQATGINNYIDAVNATRINNDYWIRNRNGNCKFLNVLQGENHKDAEDWYQRMKDFCDPKKYPNDHFNGWSMGGQNMCDVHLALKRLVSLRFDGLLEKGYQDLVHFLGTSKLEWAVLLTDIQRAIRKYHNENFFITFDCASPFLGTANGQIYIQTEIEDRSKWTYRMQPSADKKQYAYDQRKFSEVALQDGVFKNFEDSPITEDLKISDICTYAPGDLNKLGKEGNKSWDSFSYAIQMSHNVWSHINAVQRANREYDNGLCPRMLVQEKFDQKFFQDVVDEVFRTDDRDKANEIIDDHSRFWTEIPGTRGYTGKKTINATTYFNALFEEENEEDNEPEIEDGEFSEDQEQALEDLENKNLD